MTTAKFYVGQIIDHSRFGYRGVIFGVDAEFSGSDEWYQTVALSKPPKNKPWYHVLVDNASHTTYVAERNLEPSKNTQQIAHPFLGQFFGRYDNQRYFSKAKLN
ncbi:MAG: heat shock protein HspQ [Methylococcaceae bacterium]|nr:heat shock protein HspQ [Methylococcaceae bacterium]